MENFICCACGTSYPEAARPPAHCPICEDERQFVPMTGQAWTSPGVLAAGHSNAWRQHEPDLFEIRTQPDFAIGQRAFLLRTPAGNILWDCVAFLDRATETIIHALGGLDAIAISHPHYYTRMQDWAHAFGAPVHLHVYDRQWVMRPDSAIRFWEGETSELLPGMTLIRLGGHFPGGCVLHWAAGADNEGALLSGDIVQVAPDREHVSFMWSYPNMLPLATSTVRRIGAVLDRWSFSRIYGAFAGRQILGGGKHAVTDSVSRYAGLAEGEQV
jgi:hypothetical protein